MILGNLRLTASAFATAALIGAGAFVGCGDDEEESASEATTSAEESTTTAEGSADEVTLTADDAGGEYTFELSATPTPETKSVVFENVGEQPHVLIFAKINEGFTVDEAFELEGRKGSAETLGETQAAPGKSQTVELKKPLEPGNYAMLCPIPGPGGKTHYELGQLEEFEIQ